MDLSIQSRNSASGVLNRSDIAFTTVMMTAVAVCSCSPFAPGLGRLGCLQFLRTHHRRQYY